MSRTKRVFDMAGAIGGLLFFSPMMALIVVAILIDDGRPVLFRQPRVGYRRRPFSILKFRTMRDGLVTRVGRMLRITGLDEIPQFINILRGEMSAVGPRPLTHADVQRLGWTGPDFDFRWEIRPGLTGMAQLLAPDSAAEALELDRVYRNRGDLVVDCKAIAWSFVVNVFGKSRVSRWTRS